MCAYNPGVQSQAGQLYAQGMGALGAGIGDGLRQYQQNQKLTNMALGKVQGAMAANPELEKFLNGATDTEQPSKEVSPDVLKAFSKIKSGKANHNDAALASMFVDNYSKQKEEKQQADFRQMQMQQMQAQAVERERMQQQQIANQRFLQQSMQPITSTQSATGDAIAGGMDFGGLMQNNIPTTRPVTTTRQPGAAEAARRFIQTGGVPDAQTNQFFNATMDAENAAARSREGSAPTTAMRDTEAILFAELQSGKLKGDALHARRAELLAAGGRDPAERFDLVGTWVRREDRGNPIVVLKNKATAEIGYRDKAGNFKVVDSEEYMPTTASDANPLMSPEKFTAFAEDMTLKENSVRALNKFMVGVKDMPSGIAKMGTRISAAAKAISGSTDFTPDEMKLGISAARQQRLLGALRTTILGPGVLTEIDAQRIMSAVGGDIQSMVTNPAVMNESLADIMEEKFRDYERSLDVYNVHVSRGFSGAGHKQRKKIDVGIISEPKTASAPNTAVRSYNPATGRIE